MHNRYKDFDERALDFIKTKGWHGNRKALLMMAMLSFFFNDGDVLRSGSMQTQDPVAMYCAGMAVNTNEGGERTLPVYY
jgi:hypothetical protein